jgi:hypothetical protein
LDNVSSSFVKRRAHGVFLLKAHVANRRISLIPSCKVADGAAGTNRLLREPRIPPSHDLKVEAEFLELGDEGGIKSQEAAKDKYFDCRANLRNQFIGCFA